MDMLVHQTAIDHERTSVFGVIDVAQTTRTHIVVKGYENCESDAVMRSLVQWSISVDRTMAYFG